MLSQVALSEYGKDFGSNPVLTKAVLSVPYFSTKIATHEDGTSDYELDSIYGNHYLGVNLKMYRSDYFLNDFDEKWGRLKNTTLQEIHLHRVKFHCCECNIQ